MSSRIPQSFLDELLARTDIVEVIDTRITLRKMGSNYAARCPFHEEKTPSFTVSPTKQFYYCFGCSANGNAIGFLMQYERLEFIDAVNSLASKAGMTVPESTSAPETQKTTGLYTQMSEVSKYYQQQLRHSQVAIDYLKKRGLTGEIAKRFGIGFAPAGWQQLAQQFGSKPETIPQLISTGMIIQKNHENYDRFRNRIMFPIRDTRGRVIAFGGRTLGDDTPKYLNSPETSIFHKGDELYGLYEARQANSTLVKIIIVEGYMDVVTLAQHGINYAVATLGTATSQKHLQRLLRYCTDLVFCFDGDNAGQRAAWRALEQTLPLMHDGVQISFMLLPNTEDPDSLVRKEGKALFEQRIAKAESFSEFLFSQLSLQIDLSKADGKAKLAKLALQEIQKIPPGVFHELMLDKLANIVGVTLDKLQSFTETKAAKENNATPKTKTKTSSRIKSPVSLALALLLQYPPLIKEVQNPQCLDGIELAGVAVLRQLLQLLKNNPQLTTGALLENWREDKYAERLAKLAAEEVMLPAEQLNVELNGAFNRIIELAQEEKIQLLLNKAEENSLAQEERLQLQELLLKRQTRSTAAD